MSTECSELQSAVCALLEHLQNVSHEFEQQFPVGNDNLCVQSFYKKQKVAENKLTQLHQRLSRVEGYCENKSETFFEICQEFNQISEMLDILFNELSQIMLMTANTDAHGTPSAEENSQSISRDVCTYKPYNEAFKISAFEDPACNGNIASEMPHSSEDSDQKNSILTTSYEHNTETLACGMGEGKKFLGANTSKSFESRATRIMEPSHVMANDGHNVTGHNKSLLKDNLLASLSHEDTKEYRGPVSPMDFATISSESKSLLREALLTLVYTPSPTTIAEDASRKSDALRLYGFEIGGLCVFPKRHFNGTFSHHIGRLIDCTFDTTEMEGDKEYVGEKGGICNDVDLVLVSYAAPETHQQLPCRYVKRMENCPFRERCKFNHGNWVRVEDISLFQWDPVESLVVGKHVMAKYKNFLWYRGVIKNFCVNGTASSVSSLDLLSSTAIDTLQHVSINIMYDPPYAHLFTVPLLDIFPLITELRATADQNNLAPALESNDQPPGSHDIDESNNTDSDSSSDLDDIADTQESFFELEELLQHPEKPEDFGKWLKYTNGFGLKMMLKMGYKMGEPLGAKDRPDELGKGLIAPIPIRMIPPGRSLDFISKATPKKRGKRGSGRIFLAEKYGDDYVENSLRGPKARGMFGLMNAGLMDGLSSVTEKSEKATKREESRHNYVMSQLRRLNISESELRKRLLGCQEKLKLAETAAAESRKHLSRHSESKRGGSSLVSTYEATYALKNNELRRLKEEEHALQEKLKNLQSAKKLKIF